MDPFTITSSVLRITGSCVGAAHTLWEIRNAWERAPVTVSTLCAQLKLTAASLSQIQSLLLSDTEILREKPDLVNTFDTTLTSCLVLSTWLEKYMQKIKKGVHEGSKATWKMKFKTVWNEGDVKELLEQLHTQQGGISVLVNLLQMDSISEIKRLVRRHEALLREIAANTRNARETYAVEAPESILGMDEGSDSIFSKLPDTPKIKEYSNDTSFEAVILKSKVYSTTFTGVIGPASHDDHSDDTRTIIENEHVEHATLPVLNRTVLATETSSNVMHLAINTPCISTSIQNLGVSDITAFTRTDHTSCSEDELDFRYFQSIYDIRKLTGSRYHGKLEPISKGLPVVWGHFDRNKVRLKYHLRQPIKVRTQEAGSYEFGNTLFSYAKDEILDIDSILHSPFWWMERRDHARLGNKRGGLVYICDLEVGTIVEQNIDQILEFFSCPMPALTLLSKNEQRRQMCNIMWQGSEEDRGAMLAHCKSLKELQYAASEVKEHKAASLSRGDN